MSSAHEFQPVRNVTAEKVPVTEDEPAHMLHQQVPIELQSADDAETYQELNYVQEEHCEVEVEPKQTRVNKM